MQLSTFENFDRARYRVPYLRKNINDILFFRVIQFPGQWHQLCLSNVENNYTIKIVGKRRKERKKKKRKIYSNVIYNMIPVLYGGLPL